MQTAQIVRELCDTTIKLVAYLLAQLKPVESSITPIDLLRPNSTVTLCDADITIKLISNNSVSSINLSHITGMFTILKYQE